MTPTTEMGTELLKMDSMGRVRVSVERREALLAEFDRSGMSGAAFAKHYGIKYTTFAHWKRMRKKARAEKQQKEPGTFLLVSKEAVTVESSLTIELPLGAKLIVASEADARLAAVLLRALESGK